MVLWQNVIPLLGNSLEGRFINHLGGQFRLGSEVMVFFHDSMTVAIGFYWNINTSKQRANVKKRLQAREVTLFLRYDCVQS